MAVLSGESNMLPHHRQNRRRERPGSRTRRTMNRKVNASFDFSDSLQDARDSSVYLPSDRAKPSPLLRQNFDQSWQRWQIRKAEEKALADMDRTQLANDQQRLFGEDVDDDELYRMGILYNDDEDITPDSASNSVSYDLPVQETTPMFIVRHGKPRRPRRRSARRSLPLYLSLTGLSDDADIARFLTLSTKVPPTKTTKTSIHHRPTTPLARLSTDIDIPQSLPTPLSSALGSGSSLHGSHFLDNTNTVSISVSPHSLDTHSNSGDWTLIHTLRDTSASTTPSSEPETWILIDDS